MIDTLTFSRAPQAPDYPFACLQVFEVDLPGLAEKIDHRSSELNARIVANEGISLQTMEPYDHIFADFGSVNPLRSQLATVIKKGLASTSPLIAVLLASELSSGVLMGVQDGDKVAGAKLVYDIARAGEEFQARRGNIECASGEIVLRDHEGIIASLIQGPDAKTAIGRGTRNPVFFAFGIPDIGPEKLQSALEFAATFFDNEERILQTWA